jgi:hypothetical protein
LQWQPQRLLLQKVKINLFLKSTIVGKTYKVLL